MTKLTPQQLALFGLAFEVSALGWLLILPHALEQGPLSQYNQALLHLLGYGRRQLLGSSLSTLCHPEDRPRLLQLAESLLAECGATGGRGVSQLELRLLHQDGHAIWVRLQLAVLRDASGRPCYLSAEITDISRSKTLVAARMAELARLRAAEALAGLGSWEQAFGAGSAQCSPVCAKLLGLSELSGDADRIFMQLHPEDSARVKAGFAEACARRHDFALVFRVLRHSGETRYLRMQGSLFRDADGEPAGLGGYLLDITAHLTQGRLCAETARLMQLQKEQIYEVSCLLAQQLKQSLDWISALTLPETGPDPNLNPPPAE